MENMQIHIILYKFFPSLHLVFPTNFHLHSTCIFLILAHSATTWLHSWGFAFAWNLNPKKTTPTNTDRRTACWSATKKNYRTPHFSLSDFTIGARIEIDTRTGKHTHTCPALSVLVPDSRLWNIGTRIFFSHCTFIYSL